MTATYVPALEGHTPSAIYYPNCAGVRRANSMKASLPSLSMRGWGGGGGGIARALWSFGGPLEQIASCFHVRSPTPTYPLSHLLRPLARQARVLPSPCTKRLRHP